MELRTYKFRAYPNKKQKQKLTNSLKTCKTIYNELLALSIDSWKFGNISLTKFDYNQYLNDKYINIYSQSRQNVSDRVNKSFKNFFRRTKDKSCTKKGYPRFKSRINSITYPQSGFKLLSNKKLKLSKIGNIPFILHRVPKGNIKTLTIKQNNIGQWFFIFVCEIKISNVVHQHKNKSVGIDVGIKNYATFSNGKTINYPFFMIKSEYKLKHIQKKLSKKKKKSSNREKNRIKLAKIHIKIVNQRTDFLHKLSHKITKSYSFIAVEDLNIKKMIKNSRFNKSINDVSWNSFIQMLSYKAITCGGQFIKVNPRNTSKTCSKCGNIMSMPLNKREFKCSKCSFICHRDLNASYNILKVGQGLSKLNACKHDISPSLKAVVNEAGTIYGNNFAVSFH